MSMLSFVGGVILTFVFVGLIAIGFWDKANYSLSCEDEDNDEEKE